MWCLLKFLCSFFKKLSILGVNILLYVGNIFLGNVICEVCVDILVFFF